MTPALLFQCRPCPQPAASEAARRCVHRPFCYRPGSPWSQKWKRPGVAGPARRTPTAPLASVSPRLRLQLGRQVREGGTAGRAEHTTGLRAGEAVAARPIPARAPAPVADVAGAGCVTGALEAARRGAGRPTGPGDGPVPPRSGDAAVMGAPRTVQRLLGPAEGFPPAGLNPVGQEQHPLLSLGAQSSPVSLPSPQELGAGGQREGARSQHVLWHLEAASSSADRGMSLSLAAGPRASERRCPDPSPNRGPGAHFEMYRNSKLLCCVTRSNTVL